MRSGGNTLKIKNNIKRYKLHGYFLNKFDANKPNTEKLKKSDKSFILIRIKIEFSTLICNGFFWYCYNYQC